MATTLTEARAAIREIDRQIDAGRLNRTEGHHERECALFRERGELQLICANLERTSQKPLPRPQKCPSCRGTGYARRAA